MKVDMSKTDQNKLKRQQAMRENKKDTKQEGTKSKMKEQKGAQADEF